MKPRTLEMFWRKLQWGEKGGKSPLASEESLAIFIFNQTIISSFGSGGILDFIPYKPGDVA